MLTFLELRGTPTECGEQHGETLRDAIRELVDIRWTLMRKRSAIRSQSGLDSLAAEQWAFTADTWPEMAEELDGIGRGAGVSRQDLVVLNNYTDFRDIVPSTEGCTAVYAAQGTRRFLGQTWDMHASAEPFVVGLQLDDALLLTVAGCLGMMGVNRYGNAVVVNNLVSNDARAGVLWPAVVRAMLKAPTRQAMARVLKSAHLGSGHNYLLADRFGAENWETTGELKKCTWTSGEDGGDGTFCHTNHYLDPDLRACAGSIPAVSTTFERYRRIESSLFAVGSRPLDKADLVAWLSDHEGAPRSICSHMGTDDPDASKTCGGVVASLCPPHLTAWQGCLQDPGNGIVERTLGDPVSLAAPRATPVSGEVDGGI